MEQFYYFRRRLTGAVLFVPEHIRWSSSFISDAHSMAQFYLFRRKLNETGLLFPTHNKRRSSICSTGMVLKLF